MHDSHCRVQKVLNRGHILVTLGITSRLCKVPLHIAPPLPMATCNITRYHWNKVVHAMVLV